MFGIFQMQNATAQINHSQEASLTWTKQQPLVASLWCSSDAKIRDHSSKVGDILQQQIKLDHNNGHQNP